MEQKLCRTPNCGLKSLDEFYGDRTRPDRKSVWCKRCENARRNERNRKRPEPSRQRSRLHYRKCKREVMDHYGKVCQCCGEPRLDFLTLDHINQDGAEHRRKMGFTTCTGFNFYVWLRRNNWPDIGLQVLCANCNSAKGASGECPHVQQVNMIDGLGI